jgi:Tfp pilus assembly protein PilX
MRSARLGIFLQTIARRRGIALILVLVVMAVAGILAFALLTAGALQAAAGSNGITAAEAQAQAESGIHLAAYYLTHPQTAPVSAGSWGPTAVTFTSTQPPTSLPGTATVTVAAVVGTTNYFNITSVGSVPTATSGQQITRTITAELEVIPSYQITGAGESNAASLIVRSGVTITGDVAGSGTISTQGTGSISGNINQSLASPPAPTGTITDYTQQYYYQGTLYTPGPVSGTGGTYGPTASNPLGIYYYSGNITVTGPLVVTGTLYIKSGTLVDNKTITINPVSLANMTYDMPALVVDQAIQMKANATLTANGVVCTGLGITNSLANASTQVTITGALLITGNGGGITNGSAHVNITYNAAYTNVLDLVANSPPAVKVISWSE